MPLLNTMLSFSKQLTVVHAKMFFLLMLLGTASILSAQSTLSASIDDNDAYVDIDWNLDVACFTNGSGQAYEDGVFLQLKADGVVIHTETIIQDTPTAVESTYRHETGPDASFTYQLNLFEIGPGSPPCAPPINATGSTTAYEPLAISSITDGEVADQITINWMHTSKLPTRYILYRDSEVIANIDATDATTYEYMDSYKFDDITSITNGQSYNYCIETFSEMTNQTYPQVCDNGRTYDIALTASDDAFENKVELQWAAIDQNDWDKIHLYRDGELIQAISTVSGATSYVDMSPTPGKKAIYSLELLKNGVAKVRDEDIGSVAKNGLISGQVMTLDNLFPVVGAKIILSGIAGDTIVKDSVLTDFAGFFSFDEVYYEQAATFTVTASLGENSFENNPQQVTLIKLNPSKTDLLFLQDESYETDEDGTIAASDLILTPVAAQDKVDISWTYTPVSGETTFFNLYRGSTLIAALNDANGAVTSFSDLNGEPNKALTYRLVVYRINANQQVVQVPLQGNTIFPQVSAPSNFSVQADNTNGLATMTWDSHLSNNFAGFFIYRNGERIATLATDATTYTDHYAEPSSTVTYALAAYRVVSEVNKESLRQLDADVTFPALPVAENATATAQSGQDIVNLDWDVPVTLTNTYNYTGFAVYRKENGATEKTLIATKYKDFAPAGTTLTITDYTGKPEQAYIYEICTFLATPDSTYHANAEMVSATFPAVTPASNLLATPDLARIDLDWNSPASDNLDGLTVFRNGTDSLIVINQNVTTFSDELPIQGINYDYSVRSFRRVEGQIYYSVPTTVSAVKTSTWSGSPIIPAQFSATEDLPNVVKLCWEYPEFALSTFEIRREGTVIATLPTTARAYYDYDAVQGQSYNYSIRAVYNSNSTDWLAARGQKSCANRLSGRVYSSTKKIGLAFARVTVSGTDFFDDALTDVSGYYQFENLPSGTITIEIEGCNSNWTSNAANKSIDCTEQDYTQDFINDYETPSFEIDEIAPPGQVTVRPNSNMLDVVIAWTPSNENYDGFEINRGTKLLGEVAAGTDLVWVDKDGAPGHVYGYQVRAFQDTENGRVYSSYKASGGFFPLLSPVEYLTVLPYPEKNAVRLQWAHRQAVGLSYVVERNGTTIATLQNPERLEVIDTTGLPGQMYTYTVTAYYQNNTGLFAAMEESVTMTYPEVVKPLSLIATGLMSDATIMDCEGGTTTTENIFTNQVQLTWDYDGNVAAAFEIYRTPDAGSTKLIGKVTGDNLTFIDRTPLFNISSEYEVKAIIEKNGQEYASRGKKTTFSTPSLAPPIDVMITKETDNGLIRMRFRYPYAGADRVKIYRDEAIGDMPQTVIKTIPLPAEPTNEFFEFTDVGGTANSPYEYRLVAEVEQMGITYESTFGECYQRVPGVPMPSNVQASDNHNSYIEVSWEYSSDAQVDYFRVYRGTVSGGSFMEDGANSSFDLGASERSFREGFNGDNLSGTVHYKVVAFRNGQTGGLDGMELSNVDDGAIQQETHNNLLVDEGSKDVSISGNQLLLGQPEDFTGQTSKATLYTMENDEWTLSNTAARSNYDFYGYAVSVDGNYAIIGYPEEESGTNNAGFSIYDISTGTINFLDSERNTGDERLGFSVALSGTKMVAGEPGKDSESGVINKLQLQTGSLNDIVLNEVSPDGSISHYGYDVAYDGVEMLIGNPNLNNDAPGKIHFQQFDNPSQNTLNISASDGENGDEFGIAVDIDGDYAIVGAPKHGGNDFGAAYFFKKSGSGIWEEYSKVEGFANSSLGTNVAIKGDLAAISVPGAASNVISHVKVYKRNINNDWIHVLDYSNGEDEELGISVDISDDFLVAGSPNDTYVFDLLSLPRSFQASDGDFISKTTLTWEYTEVKDIEGFRIYRNGTEIASLSKTIRSYNDTEGSAGIKYAYEIEAYTSDRNSNRVADEGYRLPNGSISGEVKTLIGQTGVEHVNITAQSVVNDVLYTYHTTTDNAGQFQLDGVFYGTTGADYTITAQYEDHEFEPASLVKTLNTNQVSANGLLIFDKTAYVAKGTVTYDTYDCPLENIEVKVVNVFEGGAEIPSMTRTDEKGEYSIVINPTLNGLQHIRVEVSNTQTIGEGENRQDLTYQFDALDDNDGNNSDTAFIIPNTAFASLERISTINFVEKTTYPVQVRLANTCGEPVSNNIFKIRVRTSDGCLDVLEDLSNTGFATVYLPPINGIKINAVDVNNPTTSDLLVLDYLQYRPNTVNLYDFHVDTAQVAVHPPVRLTYHKPPQIIISSFDDYLCSPDLSNIAVVQQGNVYTQLVDVSENFGGEDCTVTEGYVIVTNPGAIKTKDTLYYDETNVSFTPYQFIAGNPNLIQPHIWIIKLQYFSAADDFLGATLQGLIVEGEAPVPGNDVVVIPQEIPTPMYILRDPPGDGSSSMVSAGEKISKEFSYKWSQDVSAKFKTDFDVSLGGRLKTSIQLSTSQSSAISNAYKLDVNVEESISTSSSAGKVGESADIIVGNGLAYEYGIVEEIKVTDCDNEITKFVKFGLSPNSIKTTWVQTVGDIEKLVESFEFSIAELNALPTDLRDGGFEEDLITFELARDNYNEVLRYHREETVPMSYICNNREEFVKKVQDDRKFHFSLGNPLLGSNMETEILQWRDALCTFKDGKIDDDGELIWDDEMLLAYNNFINAMRLLSDPVLMANDIRTLEWHFNGNPENTNDISSNLLDDSKETHPLANLFGKPAENLTIGGGTNISRTLSVGHSHTNSFDFSVKLGAQFDFTSGVDQTIEIFVGNGISGVLTNFTKFKTDFTASVGGSIQYNSTAKQSETQTNKVKYTLSDNDTGDQHNITVLQSLELNHTPYFELNAGRTSCPPEPGTIYRDRPVLQILEGDGAVKETSVFNVPAAEAATFNLKIINNSIYEETRSLVVYLDNQTNENGAIVRLAGQLMGEQTFFSVGPNQELVLPLTIERGLVAYQHETIELKVRPYCTDGNVKWPDPDFVSFSVDFQNPCSPISIVTPDNNWVINGEEDNLVVGLRDYQTDNPIFQELKLQYRRIDVGDDWDDLPGRHVLIDLSNDPLADPCEPVPYPVSKECLASYNNEFFAPGDVPTFFMVWDFPDDFTTYPDGDYEIRAVAACGTAGVTYSNVIGGRIDRSNVRLFGQPEPADGLWIPGDEISTDFNKNINCSLFDDAMFADTSFFLYHKPSGSGEVDLNTLSRIPAEVVCRNNELIFETIEPMSNFDGDSLIAVLANVTDLSGNKSDTIRWEFKVITSKLYWAEEEITVELYQDEELTVRIPLFSTEIVAPVDNAILSHSGASANWLSFSPSGTFSVQPTGRNIAFTISGNTIGNFEETILVNADGLTTALPIKIKAIVRAKAPDWEVDPTNYAETMVMVANYIFEDEPSKLSTDSLDILSVWIDGEIRGVARIEKAGMFHAAYLVIYGNPADFGHPMEFRVWKATEGVDYDAFPTEEIIYDGGTTRGNTADPEILKIDRLTGKATYLPLNQGWTYFSINRDDANDNASLDNMLRSLRKVTPADELLTQDKFAEYVEGQGWVTAGMTTLTDMDAHESYRIYLENGPDVLRLTGKDAIFENITLEEDWSWIGYPLQTEQPINSVLNFLNTPTNGDKLYTIPQTGGVELANFDGTQWNGNLSDLKPHFGYKLNIADPNILVYPPNTALNNPTLTSLRGPTIADPEDETTWIVEDYNMEFVTTLVAELVVNNELTNDNNDQLAAFVGNELRGVAHIEYVAAVDRYLAVMSIGTFAVGEDLELYLYDASIDEILPIQEPLATLQDAGYGKFTAPTTLTAAIFSIEQIQENILCNTDQTGRAEVVVSNHVGGLSYLWSTGSTDSFIENIGAGTYTVSIRDFRNIPVEVDFEIINLDADIPAPTLDETVMAACQGSIITASASNPDEYPDGDITWFDENNQVIHVGPSLTISNLQSPRTIQVATSVNTCPSDFATLNVFVYEWAEADFTADDRTPMLDIQEVTFTPLVQDPTVTYSWSFGDGTTSNEMIGKHTYSEEDVFTVVLTTTTAEGCGYVNFYSDYIVTDGSATICESPEDTDADGWKNDCDNCPMVSNALQTDNDNDGFGAACDCNDNNPDDLSRHIAGTIGTAIYAVNHALSSDGLVQSGRDVEFKAGHEITLLPGFEVMLNADFLAIIETCEDEGLQEEQTIENRADEETIDPITSLLGGNESLKIVPNPLVGEATIYYELSAASSVSLSLHSLAGEQLQNLMSQPHQKAGIYSFPFSAHHLAAGMYYVVLKVDQEIFTKKMVIGK